MRLRVVVLAPTSRELSLLQPNEVRERVMEEERARRYGNSPDDWAPFAHGVKITSYLEQVGFVPGSLSSQLARANDPVVLDALVRGDIHLILIDPVYLGLSNHYEDLVRSFDAAIRTRDLAFCVVHPESLPDDLKAHLHDLCSRALPLTEIASNEGHGEWKAENQERLKRFLGRLRRDLTARASRKTAAGWASPLPPGRQERADLPSALAQRY